MKNTLLFFVFLFLSASSFAQLFVRPTPGGSSVDSYIYAKNEIIYVEEEIHLQKNAPGNLEASIYLRNGAQLIQGGTTSTNTGNGFLSVQQNTMPTNAFAYYYWCSPVGNAAIGPATGNTNFGIASIYEDTNAVVGEGTSASQSSHISQTDGFSNPLTISRRWLHTLTTPGTEAAGNWQRINANNNVPPGFGFSMKGVNEGTSGSNTANTTLNQTYEFRGRPNNGNFTIPVAPSVGSLDSDAMMTLTGNPYPSALDLNKLFYDPDNGALSEIYFYDEDRSKMSHNYSQKPFGYGVWVPGGEDPSSEGSLSYPGIYTNATFYIWNQGGTHGGISTGSGSSSNNKRYAPIGQGFMMLGNTTGTVTIKNSHRVFRPEGAANQSVFHRPDNGEGLALGSKNEKPNNSGTNSLVASAYVDSRMSQLRLYVIFDNALTRDLVLGFSPQATDGYDRGFDGLSPMGMSSDAYFPIDMGSHKKPYVIQTTNFDASKMVPITFKLHKTSQIEIRAVEEIKKPYQKAYLYDSQENIYRPLTKAHSLAGTFTLPAGTYENRFFIVFRSNGSDQSIAATMDPQSPQPRVLTEIGLFQNNPNKQLEINNPEGHTLKAVRVFDMSGKLVISEDNLGKNTNYSFYTGNLSDGVYLVKLITSDDLVIDYKAMVMNK